MITVLILEDDANRVGIFIAKLGYRFELTCVDTAEAAIGLIQERAEQGEAFDVIFLDHDLGGEVYVDSSNKNTGSEVVRWMLSYGGVLEQPYIVIHSLNTPAAIAMEHDLQRGDFEFVYRIPFTTLKDSYLDDPSFLS